MRKLANIGFFESLGNNTSGAVSDISVFNKRMLVVNLGCCKKKRKKVCNYKDNIGDGEWDELSSDDYGRNVMGGILGGENSYTEQSVPVNGIKQRPSAGAAALGIKSGLIGGGNISGSLLSSVLGASPNTSVVIDDTNNIASHGGRWAKTTPKNRKILQQVSKTIGTICPPLDRTQLGKLVFGSVGWDDNNGKSVNPMPVEYDEEGYPFPNNSGSFGENSEMNAMLDEKVNIMDEYNASGKPLTPEDVNKIANAMYKMIVDLQSLD